ncbi:hypothetical protein [Tenacibaculum jejuense]|uniref:Uncharacterized protein n=1 Tax=Tenacibaculum jejuense TaxID=584609 RepID=A0A238U855_9FLAO|nr:hypothetical protein [Tenacibaculum jejuense]SNR15282.1 Protein of unknown function precursor, putative sensor of anti-sigma and ECF sigma factor [Tenacibaculum jejuense]
MRVSLYKTTAFVLLLSTFHVFSQKKDKNFKEEFKVKSDVVIDINTRHSDIQIETWNKDKVTVEAYMMVEGEEVTQEMKDHFYEKWDFDVTGNSKKINVKSRTNPSFNFHSFNFDDPDYSFIVNDLSDYSIGSLDVLDSIDFIMPPLPPEPPAISGIMAPPTPPMPPFTTFKMFTEFDFEKYKKDKDYLKRWKEENKEALGENAKVKIGDKSISIATDDSNITMSGSLHGNQDLMIFLKDREKNKKEREKKIKAYQKEWKEESKKLMEKAKKQLKENQEKLKKQLKKLEKQKKERKKIQMVLKNRSKLKVKRLIFIRAPKNAKFNMNVKYGELSFGND